MSKKPLDEFEGLGLAGKNTKRIKAETDIKPIPGVSFNPARPNLPPKSTTGAKPAPMLPIERDPKAPIKTPFPIVANADIPAYMAKQKNLPRPVRFSDDKSGEVDQELNELALQDIAEQEGTTVEELLRKEPIKETPVQFQGTPKQIRAKLQAQTTTKIVTPPRFEIPEVDTEIKAQEPTAIEIEIQQAQERVETLKRQAQAEAEHKAQLKKQQAAKPQYPVKAKPVHPIFQRMKEKFGLEAQEPAMVEIEGVVYEMLPPPAELVTWIIQRMKDVENTSEEVIGLKYRNLAAASTIVAIDGVSAPVVLGLLPAVDFQDRLRMTPPQRQMTAQLLLQMFEGDSEGLPEGVDFFTFHSAVSRLIQTAYMAKFGDNGNLKNSLTDDLHVFQCPVPDCQIRYEDMPLPNGNYHCRIHSTVMDDLGLRSEVLTVPLA